MYIRRSTYIKTVSSGKLALQIFFFSHEKRMSIRSFYTFAVALVYSGSRYTMAGTVTAAYEEIGKLFWFDVGTPRYGGR